MRGDRVHLQQVLLNLILNGMDALNGASPEHRLIIVSARVNGAQTVEIAVSDTGQRDHRRETPARLRSVLYHQAERHGDGSAYLAHHHRGARRPDLGENNNDGGVRPFASRCRWRKKPPRHEHDPPLVHIVDDDASFRTAAARMLGASGFVVKTFPSAGEFLAQRDRGCGGLCGGGFADAGNERARSASSIGADSQPFPLLFLTGQGDIPTSVRAMRDGAEDFLEKTAPKESCSPR